MHKYRNKKLPISFSHIFTDASDAGGTNFNRHSDYNYDTVPATKKIPRKISSKTNNFQLEFTELGIKSDS